MKVYGREIDRQHISILTEHCTDYGTIRLLSRVACVCIKKGNIAFLFTLT